MRAGAVFLWLIGCGGDQSGDIAQVDPALLERGSVAEALLGPGLYPIGFTSTTLYNGTRRIDVMVWYPARWRPGAEQAVYPQAVPAPAAADGFLNGGQIPASSYAEALDAHVPDDPGSWEPLWAEDVLAGLPAAPGRHPVLVHLAGGNAPAFVMTYEATQYAAHGVVFVSAASRFQAPTNLCDLDRDAVVVLDTVLGWDETPGHPLEEALDTGAIFGGGHSLGGRTWLARSSTATECGLPREQRLAGLILKDPTREQLTVAQMTGNDVPALVSSQACRFYQIELQDKLASEPPMMMLDGYVPLDRGWTPLPDTLVNHSLFAQTCASVFANDAASNAAFRVAVPPVRRGYCDDSTGTPNPADDDARYIGLERFFAAQDSRYGVAWLEQQTGHWTKDAPFLPWIDDPGTSIVAAGDTDALDASCPGWEAYPSTRPF